MPHEFEGKIIRTEHIESETEKLTKDTYKLYIEEEDGANKATISSDEPFEELSKGMTVDVIVKTDQTKLKT